MEEKPMSSSKEDVRPNFKESDVVSYNQQVQSGGKDGKALLESHSISTGPASLDYDFYKRRWSLFANLTWIIGMNFFASTAVYYGVKFGKPSVTPGTLYGAVTAVLGTLEVPFFPWRWYQLSKRGGERSSLPDSSFESSPSQGPFKSTEQSRSKRVKLAFQRWDLFQWQFLFGIILEATLLTLGCSLNGDFGDFNLLCLSVPSLWLFIGIQMILSVLLNKGQVKSPWRLSSRDKGSVIEPGLFYIWQDLTAVDGAGTNEFRLKFSHRYDSSPMFRKMISDLSLIMGMGLIFVFPLVAIVVYGTPDKNSDLIWGTTMGINVVWLGLVAAICIWFVKRGLRREKQWWQNGKM